MLRRIALLGTALAVLMVAPVLAANPHFVKGPTFSDLGTTLQATGSIAGLGNEDVTIVLDAVGVAEVTCTNKGGTQAPGKKTHTEKKGTPTANKNNDEE